MNAPLPHPSKQQQHPNATAALVLYGVDGWEISSAALQPLESLVPGPSSVQRSNAVLRMQIGCSAAASSLASVLGF